MNDKFSIIIPAYNEGDVIAEALNNLKNYLKKNFSYEYEIIVVNDGSSDKTAEILNTINNIKTINHPYNKGYGASVKTGVATAKFDWILVFDADGQHRPEDIKNLTESRKNFDMVIGARQGYQGPLIRQFGKKILKKTAEYLVEKKIPDLNSGLRLVKKKYFLKYSHLFPNAFSWTSTITLAFLKNGLNVNYIPIKINKRQGGKSMVKPSDAFKLLMSMIRLIMLFSPLRVFLPVSFILFLAGVGFIILDIITLNISEGTILILLTSILIFFFGLIADQVAAIRREINK